MNREGLENIPLLRTVSSDIVAMFVPFSTGQNYPAGSVIFKEGSSAESFFIIKSGEVEIRKVIERKPGFKLIAVLGKGEFFGEMAIFAGQPRSAEVVAKTDVTVLSVSKDNLSAMIKSDPEVALKAMSFFTSVLIDRLSTTTNELVVVYDIGRFVTSARSVAGLSEYVISALMKTVEAGEAGFFVVWNEFNREFEVSHQSGFDLKAGEFLPADDRLGRWFLDNKEPLLAFDLHDEPEPYRSRSMVASPFLSNDRLLGFMGLLSRTKGNAFSYNHMVLLSTISGYVSVALDNLRYMRDETDRGRLHKIKGSVASL